MPQQRHHTGNTSLFAMNGIFGQIQFVSSDRRVLIDLSSDLYDVDGYPQREHAVASLSVSDARRCRALLDQAIAAAESADGCQPGLWSDTTYTLPLRPRTRSNVHTLFKVAEVDADPLTIPPYPSTMR